MEVPTTAQLCPHLEQGVSVRRCENFGECKMPLKFSTGVFLPIRNKCVVFVHICYFAAKVKDEKIIQ